MHCSCQLIKNDFNDFDFENRFENDFDLKSFAKL